MTGMSHLISSKEVLENVELLTKILVRLPAKLIVRSKCVSKHWLSLISHPEFSKTHAREKINSSITGFYFNSQPLINFPTSSSNDLPNLDFLANLFRVNPIILHSRNGLFLCSCGPKMVVCNLTTQKLKIIPLPPSHSEKSILDTFIAFDPMRSPEYKIVLVSAPSSKIDFIFNIYSSESQTWKNICFREPLFDPLVLFHEGVLCDGAVYWAFSINNLARFDINKENLTKVQVISTPLIPGRHIMYFGEYGGHLFLAHTAYPMQTDIQVLEMNMQSFSWNFKYNINLAPIIGTLNPINYHHSVKILCFNRENEEETHTLMLAVCKKVYIYNPKCNCLEFLKDFSGQFDEMPDFERLRAQVFIESLALP